MVSLLNFLFPDAEGALEVIKSTVFICLNYLFVKKISYKKKESDTSLSGAISIGLFRFIGQHVEGMQNSNKNVVKVMIHVNGALNGSHETLLSCFCFFKWYRNAFQI